VKGDNIVSENDNIHTVMEELDNGKTVHYSPGITGWELWKDRNAEGCLKVLYVGTQSEQIARSYKIRQTKSGRQFVQPYGHRIYLDQCYTNHYSQKMYFV